MVIGYELQLVSKSFPFVQIRSASAWLASSQTNGLQSWTANKPCRLCLRLFRSLKNIWKGWLEFLTGTDSSRANKVKKQAFDSFRFFFLSILSLSPSLSLWFVRTFARLCNYLTWWSPQVLRTRASELNLCGAFLQFIFIREIKDDAWLARRIFRSAILSRFCTRSLKYIIS